MRWAKKGVQITNETLNLKDTNPIVKHGEDTVRTGACLSSFSVATLVFIEDTLSQHMYQNMSPFVPIWLLSEMKILVARGQRPQTHLRAIKCVSVSSECKKIKLVILITTSYS